MRAYRQSAAPCLCFQAVLLVSGFAGISVWLIVASLYYLAERNNPLMVWEAGMLALPPPAPQNYHQKRR
eukprot:COSAG05_NODE_500_length_9234_cov_107.281664_6_plen_69_part_00